MYVINDMKVSAWNSVAHVFGYIGITYQMGWIGVENRVVCVVMKLLLSAKH